MKILAFIFLTFAPAAFGSNNCNDLFLNWRDKKVTFEVGKNRDKDILPHLNGLWAEFNFVSVDYRNLTKSEFNVSGVVVSKLIEKNGDTYIRIIDQNKKIHKLSLNEDNPILKSVKIRYEDAMSISSNLKAQTAIVFGPSEITPDFLKSLLGSKIDIRTYWIRDHSPDKRIVDTSAVVGKVIGIEGEKIRVQTDEKRTIDLDMHLFYPITYSITVFIGGDKNP